MKKVRIFVVCCFVVALAAFPALASGAGTPTFKAVSKLSRPTHRICDPTAKASWRNVSGGAVEVVVEYFVNGLFTNFTSSGAFLPASHGSFIGGSLPTVRTGDSFSFLATFSTATDGSPVKDSNGVTC